MIGPPPLDNHDSRHDSPILNPINLIVGLFHQMALNNIMGNLMSISSNLALVGFCSTIRLNVRETVICTILCFINPLH